MTSELLRRLHEYRQFTAMVVGDFMLDQHVHGAAERLSPDAPVPVLLASRFEDSPGGSSNVARCLEALKAEVLCVGVTGVDPEASLLRKALEKAGCTTDGLIADATRPTTIKRSLVGLAQHRHPQKMFRVDIESREPISDDVREGLLSYIDAHLDRTDVVCLEDYNKGVCTPAFCRALIERCRAKNKPVLVDPAAIEDYSKYRGATAITPNRSEAELATGLDTPLESTHEHNVQMAELLLKDLALDAVIVTLDKHGALLARPGEEPIAVPTVARSVYDVSGAGDMVLAALAGGRANGFSWQESVILANAAAGLEVEVFGAQPIPFVKVQREMLRLHGGLDGKVRSLDDLLVEIAVHREAGQRIVLTNGCFDVIHAGHVQYLREAKRQGDVLIVGVNADDEVASLKGAGRPVYKQTERLEILNEFESIDYLVVFTEPTAHRLIEAVRPDVYVKGGDYRPEDVREYDLLKPMMERGELEFRTIAFRPGLSSTTVIERFVRAYGGEPAAKQ